MPGYLLFIFDCPSIWEIVKYIDHLDNSSTCVLVFRYMYITIFALFFLPTCPKAKFRKKLYLFKQILT